MSDLPKDISQYTTLYIVRHGESHWNVKQLVQGQTDIALTQTGEAQAREASDKLKHIEFAAVFSSDLMRARRTAEIIALEKQLAVKTTTALRERAFGRFEGQTRADYMAQTRALFVEYQKLADADKPAFQFAPDVETDAALLSRVMTFLREVALAYIGKNLLVVSHSGVMRHLLIHLGYKSYAEIDTFKIGNAAYIKLLSNGSDFFVVETNGITGGMIENITV